MLGVASNHSVTSWGKAKPIAGTAEKRCPRPGAFGLETAVGPGDGAKGPRLYDWAYVELADLDASEYDASRSGLWTRGLLIRRTIADHDLAFFSTWAPAGTSIDKLVRVEGCRWAIEDSFETTKNELGLDHNETRSWHGMASPRLARHAGLRHDGHDPASGQCDASTANDTPDLCGPPLIRWSIQEIRRIAIRLAQRRIEPARIIAWSLWRRAHQAAAQKAHFKIKLQL